MKSPQSRTGCPDSQIPLGKCGRPRAARPSGMPLLLVSGTGSAPPRRRRHLPGAPGRYARRSERGAAELSWGERSGDAWAAPEPRQGRELHRAERWGRLSPVRLTAGARSRAPGTEQTRAVPRRPERARAGPSSSERSRGPRFGQARSALCGRRAAPGRGSSGLGRRAGGCPPLTRPASQLRPPECAYTSDYPPGSDNSQ